MKIFQTEAEKKLKESQIAAKPENTAPYTARRTLSWVILTLAVIAMIAVGIRLLQDRKYNLVSVIVAFLSCLPFYMAYEKREGSIRRLVLIAVMTAIAVSGRLMFGPLPYFKPMIAIVILTGIYMGPESGFLVGSLSAVISNIFFGQGPWTPFQMLTWGILGLLPGLPFLRMLLRKRGPLIVYAIFAGGAYSWIMDIWTVFSLDGAWNWGRYLAALGTALPVTITYMVANVVFLMLTLKPIGEKMERIQIKHGIF